PASQSSFCIAERSVQKTNLQRASKTSSTSRFIADFALSPHRVGFFQASPLQKVAALAHAYRTFPPDEAKRFVDGERTLTIPAATLRSKGLVERIFDRQD